MTKIKVIQSVSHGVHHLHQGQVKTLPNAIAKELIDLKFVAATDEPEDGEQPAAVPAAAAKMADPVDNKMADAPVNKAVTAKKAK